MRIKWFGTASLEITSDAGTRILTDPFFRMNRTLTPIGKKAFCGSDGILITHGHFDHLYDVPRILDLDQDVTVHCTPTPKGTLLHHGIDPDRIHCINPGDEFDIKDLHIKAHRGHHVDFNMAYITSILPKLILMFPKTFRLLYLGATLPENSETIIYEIRADGKTALVMGSFGVNYGVKYPEGPDVIVLPYSGNSDIPSLADSVIDVIRPAKIIFDHFDNSFPPMTKRMDVENYAAKLTVTHPEIDVIIPQERRSYTI